MFHPTLFDAALVAVTLLAAVVGLTIATLAGSLAALVLRTARGRRGRASAPEVVEGQWRVLPR